MITRQGMQGRLALLSASEPFFKREVPQMGVLYTLLLVFIAGSSFGLCFMPEGELTEILRKASDA